MVGRTIMKIFLAGFFLATCSENSPDIQDPPDGEEPIEPAIVRIVPAGGSVSVGEAFQFEAEVEGSDGRVVTWSVDEEEGGLVDSSGLYTAPLEPGSYTVRATLDGDEVVSAEATVVVIEGVAVTVAPEEVELEYGDSAVFAAQVTGTTDTEVVWSVEETDGGTIEPDGVYVAPEQEGVFHVVATSRFDPRRSDRGKVKVRGPVRVEIEPATIELEFDAVAQFQAVVSGTTNHSVQWEVVEAAGGAIDASGVYRAPKQAGLFHVKATSVADPRRSATSTVSVRPPVHVAILPAQVELDVGEQMKFAAVVTNTTDSRVSWEVVESDGGNVEDDGTYYAPGAPGTFHVVATSVADPRRSATATVNVVERTISMDIIPAARRTTFDPGIPGGIPTIRQVHTTLSSLPRNGTGDVTSSINSALRAAAQRFQSTGVIQEVVLPAGTYRFTGTINLDRSGVVLRGEGTSSRLRYDGNQNNPAILVGQSRWTNYGSSHGPWYLTADGTRGSKTIRISAANAQNIQVGDIVAIDEEDDPSFIRLGNGWYGKRQPSADTHGPALRGSGLHRSVGTATEVVGKSVSGSTATLTLRDPLHMNFRQGRYAQVWHMATPRSPFGEVQHVGLEKLYLTGGTIKTNNVSYCWMDELEVDGNPGTRNTGSYNNQGGITGHSIELFHAYRCEVRGSYIHHSRNITQGGGAYLLEIGGYTSETLIEDNIIVYGNKLVVGNMMGGGNVIAYNYVDNARTNSATWQEGAIDLNHLVFSHNALVEGNWTTNMGADTTHGNSGWHVFHRNFATGQNSNPLYGAYPYTSGRADTSFRRAVGVDGYSRETTFIGNVLHAGSGTRVYQVDHTSPQLSAAAIWRIGGAVDGEGSRLDDGTALRLLYRHGNWDSVTGNVVWDNGNSIRTIPHSLYLTSKPAFFGSHKWPWVDPLAPTAQGRVGVLPAKARYEAMGSP